MLTLLERVLVLAEVPLFAEMRSEDLSQVAAVASEVDYAAGEAVYGEGDAPDALHVVLSGDVRLEAPGVTLSASAGQAFGSWGLLDRAPRRLSAATVSPTRLLTIDRDAFDDVLADNVRVARGVLQVVARRVRKALLEGPVQLSDDARRALG